MGRVLVAWIVVLIINSLGWIPQGQFWTVGLIATVIAIFWGLIEPRILAQVSTDSKVGFGARFFSFLLSVAFSPFIAFGIILLIDEVAPGATESLWFYWSGVLALIIFTSVIVITGSGFNVVAMAGFFAFLSFGLVAGSMIRDFANDVKMIELFVDTDSTTGVVDIKMVARNSKNRFIPLSSGDLVKMNVTGSYFLNTGASLDEYEPGGKRSILDPNDRQFGHLMPTVSYADARGVVQEIVFDDIDVEGDARMLFSGIVPDLPTGATKIRMGYAFNLQDDGDPFVFPESAHFRMKVGINTRQTGFARKFKLRIQQFLFGVTPEEVVLRGPTKSSRSINLGDYYLTYGDSRDVHLSYWGLGNAEEDIKIVLEDGTEAPFQEALGHLGDYKGRIRFKGGNPGDVIEVELKRRSHGSYGSSGPGVTAVTFASGETSKTFRLAAGELTPHIDTEGRTTVIEPPSDGVVMNIQFYNDSWKPTALISETIADPYTGSRISETRFRIWLTDDPGTVVVRLR